MQGSSRGSRAAAFDRVEPLLAGPGTAALAEELFGVVALLDSSAGLRRALTDPSREGAVKADLVSRLLTGKVSTAALELVAGTVRDRWARTRDLADTLEEIGALAVLASAQSAGDLDAVEEELFRYGRLLASNADLLAALNERRRSTADKARLVDTLLAGRVRPQTLVLARHASTVTRGRSVQAALEAFGQAAAERRQLLVARVTSAAPLTEAQTGRLSTLLGRLYGRTMHLDLDVDPGVLAGLRVQVGDEVIDATILTRLDEARRRLAG